VLLNVIVQKSFVLEGAVQLADFTRLNAVKLFNMSVVCICIATHLLKSTKKQLHASFDPVNLKSIKVTFAVPQ
jgi:hypothetical protein